MAFLLASPLSIPTIPTSFTTLVTPTEHIKHLQQATQRSHHSPYLIPASAAVTLQAEAQQARPSRFHRSIIDDAFLDLRQLSTALSRPGLRSPLLEHHWALTPAWQLCAPHQQLGPTVTQRKCPIYPVLYSYPHSS